jgi:aryl-alcohol dehydrogenase-like predicted oxidoreductase
VEETLRTLDDLVAAGKIRYVGFSDVPAWKTAEAQTLAHFRGWAPIIAVQLEYSLLERTAEGELIPMARSLGMGVMPWSPLKNGFLSGRYSRNHSTSVESPRSGMVGVPSERDYDVIDVLERIAGETGAAPATVAIAWVHQRPGVSSTLIGARRIDQLRSNLTALDLVLAPDQLAALDEISTPALNFPADNNRDFAPLVQFAGATVDREAHGPSPLLAASEARY